jgi:NAD(P)-dependent dehydrogenase (short-subunit alcohol dehydrogenase family)
MAFSVVTGANRGIGLALVAELAARGHTVLAACRKSSPDLAKLGAEVAPGVDVSTDQGIAALVAAVGARLIDLLVNNAGILVWGDQLGELNVDG